MSTAQTTVCFITELRTDSINLQFSGKKVSPKREGGGEPLKTTNKKNKSAHDLTPPPPPPPKEEKRDNTHRLASHFGRQPPPPTPPYLHTFVTWCTHRADTENEREYKHPIEHT